MRKNKILKSALHICILLVSTNSISQIKSSLSIEPGINRDSLVEVGTNLKYTHYLDKKPISFNASVGYYSNLNRSNENEFNYSYYKRSNLISSLGLNYLAIQNRVGFNLEILSRLSLVQLTEENYKKIYSFRQRSFQISDLTKSSNNVGIGFGVILKKRYKNQAAVFLLAGSDYLLGDNPRLTQNLNVGLEIPLSKIRNNNDIQDIPKNKTNVVKQPIPNKSEKPKTKETTQVKPKQEEITKQVKVETPTKSINQLSKDTLSIARQKEIEEKPILKKTIIDSALTNKKASTINLNTEKNITKLPVVEERSIEIKTIDNKVAENKRIIEKAIITEKKPVKTESVQEVKAKEPIQPKLKSTNESSIVKSKPLKVEGPKNIEGIQYELGDSWNYWEGENNKWYAKRKGKAKWYDLFESLSNSNYNKASLILQEEGKKVE